jgi:NAD(P)-dependent dehydrogenase (short-subunit alcohol dehydrogenase family)
VNFTGKIVLVTGASRGIGRETARQFARNGARIAVHYHTHRQAAEQTLAMLDGDSHLIVQADVANAADVQRMVKQVVDEMGGLNIVVNNAAIYAEHPIAKLNYDEWQAAWEQTIQTNLIGAANVMFCAAQHMMAHGGGHIVNVSSRGAFRGEPTAPAYGASKAGLNAMSQSLAVALAPHNIFVTVVAPGWVETEMAAAELAGPRGDAVRNQSPLGRVAKPEEVAHTILFLASSESAFLTGAVVDVNGASYLRT